MAGYWPSSLFACLWTETESRPISTQKKNLAPHFYIKKGLTPGGYYPCGSSVICLVATQHHKVSSKSSHFSDSHYTFIHLCDLTFSHVIDLPVALLFFFRWRKQ